MMSRLLTRREQFILGFLAVALLAGSITVFALRNASSTPAPIVVESDAAPMRTPPDAQAVEAPTAGQARAEIVVSIQGEIVKPGVYTVDANSRVHELIEMAGGLTAKAATATLNLAAPLVDGTTLTVPGPDAVGTEATSGGGQNPAAYTVTGQASTSGSAASAGGRINLNTASQTQLESLPGIGPKLAQQIVLYRESQPFRTVDDLDNVSGIGTARLEAVREFVTVQ